MFVHDPSLYFVEAEESDVVAIHRSTGVVSAALEGMSPCLCNAYVCAIQRKGITRVYVVLEHADRKGRWVFAAPEGVADGNAYLPLFKEGLAFAASFGFTLQEVNLSYGKAMREVVIRDIPVIRRPSVAEPPTPDAVRDTASPVKPPSYSAGASSGYAKKEVAPKENQVTGSTVEIDQGVKPSPRDENEAKALAERLAAEKAETERGALERLAVLASRIDLLAAERKEQDTALAVLEAALRAEIERLTSEREKADKEHAKAVATLRDTIKRLKGELDELSARQSAAAEESATRIGELEAWVERLAAETAALRREMERFAAEKALAGQAAQVGGPSIQARVAGLAFPGEKPVSARHGRTEQVGPESLVAATKGVEATSEVSTAVEWDDEVAAAVGEALAEGETDPFGFGGEGEEFVSFGAAGAGGSSGPAVGFSLDKTVEVIECDSPADVIEVHSSLNVVNITPAGHTPQPCGAYVVALGKGELFRVHVAWSLTDDHSTLVYSPGKQPADAEECSRVVRDALAFVETVGFMMDAVRLNADPDKRGRALAKIPVLRLKR